MPYVAQSDLTGEIPEPFLIEALDDDRDGVADEGVWDSIAAAVAQDIDSPLSKRYDVPFTAPLPPKVVHCARIFALEKVYQRRGLYGDKNPWTAQADKLREELVEIGNGEDDLDVETEPEKTSGAVITETARTTSSTGRLSA